MKAIRSSLLAVGLIAGFILPIQAGATTFVTDATWLATDSVPSDAGWNTALSFDTAGWVNAVVNGNWDGIDGIWHPNLVPPADGSDPFYGYTWGQQVWFRQTIDLPVSFGSATITAWADDDSKVYVNGNLVIDDASSDATFYPAIDIGSYLHAGQNLIAVVATDTYCCGRAFGAQIDVAPVPEPQTYAILLTGLGLLGFVARRRKQNLT